MTGTLRRDNLYSHTSPLSQPHPQMTTHQCIQKSISVSCSLVVHSTARLNILLYILVSIPSWSSGTQHTLAAFGSNLGFVPLDKRFLQKTTFKIRDTLLRYRSQSVGIAKEDAVFLIVVRIDILKFNSGFIMGTSGSIKHNLINAEFYFLYLLFSVKFILCICKP